MQYSLEPQAVPLVETEYRSIRTPLPVPESLETLRALRDSEPRSMGGQPPVVWHRAEGFQVEDRWGNRWIDWSSGVLVTNAGHGRKEIREAILDTLQTPLLTTYGFAYEKRAALTRALQGLSPDPQRYRVFLLTTGSEGIENSIKLSKTYALEKCGPRKKYIVSFTNAFHGRTLGAQLAGGQPKLKRWIVDEGRTFVQVPFPDGYLQENTSFDTFVESLEAQGIAPADVAGILTESYQGGGVNFLPTEYARELEGFCREHDIVMTYDEVQAGFGRTGRMFAYEHYGVKPDLIVCGKGITSSLPLSAVIGRKDIMDLYPPGSMTSTHSASPLPVAAALASLEIIRSESLVENSRKMGIVLAEGLQRLQERRPDIFARVNSRGLVAGVQTVKSGTTTPDPETAFRITESCFRKGLLMCAPVGDSGQCVKIAPPLVIHEGALRESIGVLEEACTEVLG